MPNMTDATQTPEIMRQAPAGRVVLWTGEVATLAGVTAMTVTRWASSGKLASSRTPGGNRRYSFAAVAELLAEQGRPVPWWLNQGAQAVAEAAGSSDLEELSLALDLIEDWLRQDCSARHAEEMADTVRRASRIIYDLAFSVPGNSG